MVHETGHRLPVLVDDGWVAKLLPYRPGHNDSGIGPSQSHHLVTILAGWCHTWESASLTLRVAHVARPFMEETVCIGEERACSGKYLGIGHPSQSLVALRTVCWNREVIGALSPDGVGYDAVDQFMTGCDDSCFQRFGDGGDGQRLDLPYLYLIGGRDGNEAVAEEGAMGMIIHEVLAVVKGVVQSHAFVLYAEVPTMHTSLRTVHAPALGTIAVVQDLCWQTGQYGASLGLEAECGHGRAVLSEIHDERLAGLECDGLSVSIVAQNNHLAIFHFFFILSLFLTTHALPDINLLGLQGEVLTQIHLCAFRWEYLTFELRVRLRFGELVHCRIARQLTGIVGFSVKDGGMFHRTGNARLPVVAVGAVVLLRPVSERHLQHASEGTLLTDHTLRIARCDNLVSPPAWRHLCRELVLRSLLLVEGCGHVVGKRPFGLGIVREAGLQDLFADESAIQIQFVNAQSCGHPLGRCDFLVVRDIGHKPAGTIGSPDHLVSASAHDWRIGSRYPLGMLPGGGFQTLGLLADVGMSIQTECHSRD